MKTGRRARAGVSSLAVVLAWVGCAGVACSKSSNDPNAPRPVKMLGERFVPRGGAAPAPTETATASGDEPKKDPTGGHVTIGDQADAAPLTYTVKVVVDSGPKEDPDLAVVEGGRRSASGCFTNISSGPDSRSASITVHVLPSGAVSRTEVSAETTQEPWVLSCLEGVGEGLRFADKPKADIRVFNIGVTVSRRH